MTSFEIAAFLTGFNGCSSIFEVAVPSSTIHSLFKKICENTYRVKVSMEH